MTNLDKLLQAEKLVNEVWGELVPDIAPTTVAEEEYFDHVNSVGERIISDIGTLTNFVVDKQ